MAIVNFKYDDHNHHTCSAKMARKQRAVAGQQKVQCCHDSLFDDSK